MSIAPPQVMYGVPSKAEGDVRLEVSTEAWSLRLGGSTLTRPLDPAQAAPLFHLALRLTGREEQRVGIVGAGEARTWAVLAPTRGDWPGGSLAFSEFVVTDPAGRSAGLPLRPRTPPYAWEVEGWGGCVDAVLTLEAERAEILWSITETELGRRELLRVLRPGDEAQEALAATAGVREVVFGRAPRANGIRDFVRRSAPDLAMKPPRCPVAGLYVDPDTRWSDTVAAIDALSDSGFPAVCMLR
ncbi:hypothetical protein OV203_19350 [Nannocystis sp. ILAH1]|uniref:hypothetical protein n=1 Tax=unclassified Nannocystis TaxID=2627009 RepID=UPI0022719BF5|nr:MULTISPECIES: hypothetical protein [unclassified Nannocystis]MCY0989304.1 hypothetical protein [Nannocystis sp. ILAH1]MCY1065001.1 hypothetical protein [Nannocystis sp. RBIL2]